MSIIGPDNNITVLRASDVPIGSRKYGIDWDSQKDLEGANGRLIIYGIATFAQLSEVMAMLRPTTTEAAPVVKAEAVRVPKLTMGDAAPVLPVPKSVATMTAADIRAEMDETPAPEPIPPPATKAPAIAPLANDLSAFGRMNLLGEIVSEIQARGANTYAQVWAFIVKLRDTEICSAIEKLEKDGKLEERVKRQCVSKGIEGAL